MRGGRVWSGACASGACAAGSAVAGMRGRGVRGGLCVAAVHGRERGFFLGKLTHTTGLSHSTLRCKRASAWRIGEQNPTDPLISLPGTRGPAS